MTTNNNYYKLLDHKLAKKILQNHSGNAKKRLENIRKLSNSTNSKRLNGSKSKSLQKALFVKIVDLRQDLPMSMKSVVVLRQGLSLQSPTSHNSKGKSGKLPPRQPKDLLGHSPNF